MRASQIFIPFQCLWVKGTISWPRCSEQDLATALSVLPDRHYPVIWNVRIVNSVGDTLVLDNSSWESSKKDQSKNWLWFPHKEWHNDLKKKIFLYKLGMEIKTCFIKKINLLIIFKSLFSKILNIMWSQVENKLKFQLTWVYLKYFNNKSKCCVVIDN